MIIATQWQNIPQGQTGYIAGTGNGIVTVAGVPSERKVYLLDIHALKPLAITISNKNGQYLFMRLDPTKKYLLMCRDLPPDGVHERYEPFCWDYVTPMTDLTLDEQQQLWQQMTEK